MGTRIALFQDYTEGEQWLSDLINSHQRSICQARAPAGAYWWTNALQVFRQVFELQIDIPIGQNFTQYLNFCFWAQGKSDYAQPHRKIINLLSII